MNSYSWREKEDAVLGFITDNFAVIFTPTARHIWDRPSSFTSSFPH
jgi:hypothetical protein